MRIRRDLLDEIIAHSREDDPNECCGVLAGPDGVADRAIRAQNSRPSPTAFEISGQDLLRIYQETNDGEDFVALYHSHTRSEAYPSQTDINMAPRWPGTVWLICSLAEAEPVIRGFEIEDGRVTELEIEPVD
ncbi:M67 family metallopeptidase [Thermoleophilia bacterium SCSIO 60948]|nr:M67 family metallopeptidase [Thermoleophilia bacterium SCSIO 60948]